jgi:hypothetical protein
MKLAQIFHQPQNVLFYVREENVFVQNVLECLGISCFVRKCNADGYKRWAKTGVLVSCMMYTF